jgi:hypothetical protein
MQQREAVKRLYSSCEDRKISFRSLHWRKEQGMKVKMDIRKEFDC